MPLRKKRVSIAAKTATNNASMGEATTRHADHVLSDLVHRLVSRGGIEDEDVVEEEGHEDALKLATSIIEGHVSLQKAPIEEHVIDRWSRYGTPSVAEDLPHVSDLIKQKCRRRFFQFLSSLTH